MVVLNGFGDKAAIEDTCRRLGETHQVPVMHDGADMSKGNAVRGLVAATIEKLGRVDILVNNAGIQFAASVEEFPAAKWDAILAINLSAAFHGIAAAVPQMKKQGWGRIVNIASAHGLVASVHKAAYVAAKHGLVGLTKVVGLETAGPGLQRLRLTPRKKEAEIEHLYIDVDASDRIRGILVIDAFSSDAIPLHLLTREALQLYLSKLTDDGILAFHVSNRYLNLHPVLANLAAEGELTTKDLAAALGWHTVPAPGLAVKGTAAVISRIPFLPPEAYWIQAFKTSVVMDTEKARRSLRWQPKHDSRAVLMQTVAAARERGLV